MKDLVKQCAKATGWSQSATMNEVNLFCEIVGLPKNSHNNLIGNDPHGVVDFQEGYMFFNMSDIHVVVSEYEHWLKIYGNNETIAKTVREWYYYCIDWHNQHSYEEPRWVRVKDKMPKENDAVLVRGEMKNNGHADEFYVFLVENGEFITATSGKPIKKHDGFKDYTFTHWKPIITPKQEAERSKGCPNLRSWLLGCPIPGLREATAEYKENYDKAIAKAKANRDASYKALKEAIEQESKESRGGEV